MILSIGIKRKNLWRVEGAPSTPRERHTKKENNELKSKKPTSLIRVEAKAWI